LPKGKNIDLKLQKEICKQLSKTH